MHTDINLRVLTRLALPPLHLKVRTYSIQLVQCQRQPEAGRGLQVGWQHFQERAFEKQPHIYQDLAVLNFRGATDWSYFGAPPVPDSCIIENPQIFPFGRYPE